METYAGFQALDEIYFCIYENIFAVFLILLTGEITDFEPEVVKWMGLFGYIMILVSLWVY